MPSAHSRLLESIGDSSNPLSYIIRDGSIHTEIHPRSSCYFMLLLVYIVPHGLWLENGVGARASGFAQVLQMRPRAWGYGDGDDRVH